MAAHQELQRFVREALSRGQSREAVGRVLGQAGWDRREVALALEGYSDVDFPVPVPRPRPALDAREAFLYLVLFAALYTSALNFGTLIFHFIDRLVVDPAATRAPVDSAVAGRDLVRLAVASLGVAFPAFLFASRAARRVADREEARRPSAIRRWLTYLTLFIATVIVIGDLVMLVFDLLAGAITVGFSLKALAVGGLALSVLSYYQADLRADEGDGRLTPARRRLFAVAASAAVAIVLAGGLFAAGTPGEERLRRLDALRVRHLDAIARAVEGYDTRRHALPPTIAALAPEANVAPWHDPATGAAYEYRVTGDRTFVVCATFDRPSETDVLPAAGLNWSHAAGKICFDREIPPPK